MDDKEERIVLHKLHGKTTDSFQLWKLRVEAVLETNSCMSIVSGTEPRPTNGEENAIIIAGTPTEGIHFIADSGATHHVYHNRELFCSLVPYNNQISLGGGGFLHSRLIGTIDAIIPNEKSEESTWIRLSNVLYVQDLGINIISVSALDRNDVTTLFKKGNSEFFDGRAKRTLGTTSIDK